MDIDWNALTEFVETALASNETLEVAITSKEQNKVLMVEIPTSHKSAVLYNIPFYKARVISIDEIPLES